MAFVKNYTSYTLLLMVVLPKYYIADRQADRINLIVKLQKTKYV